MILGVFAVFDSKAVNYGTPFFTHNRGSAQRGIQAQLRADKSTMLAMYPGDFSLHDLGTYNDETGEFAAHPPIFVINVSELVESSDNVQQS